MKTNDLHFIIFVILIASISACKKSSEISSYKIENGIIGIKASGSAEFGVDPGNENSFVFKNPKVNQRYSTLSALNTDQSKLYLQRRDSLRRLFIDEISTFNGKTIRSIPYNISFNEMVFDSKQNRLFELVISGSNTCDIYSLNLTNVLWEYHGRFVKDKLFTFQGKSFMRQDKIYIVSYNDIFCFDPSTNDMKHYFTIGQNFDSEYDPIYDCIYILKNGGAIFTLSKFSFSTGILEDILPLPDVSDIIQSSMCLKIKTNELVFYTYSNKRITISLDDLKVKNDIVQYALLSCHALYNNVEISLKDIE